jgi:hypothetical protein
MTIEQVKKLFKNIEEGRPVWLGFQAMRAQGRTPSKVQQTNRAKKRRGEGVGAY